MSREVLLLHSGVLLLHSGVLLLHGGALLLHSGVLLLHSVVLLLHSVVLLPLLRRSGVLLFLLLNNPVLTTSQMKQEAKPIITTLLRPLQ